MKTFPIVSMLLVASMAFAQEDQEKADLKTAVVTIATIMVQEKAKKEDAQDAQTKRADTLILELTKVKDDLRRSNERTMILGAIALPLGLFAGGSSRGDFARGSILACSAIGAEVIIWGARELYQMYLDNPDPPAKN